MLKRGLLVCAVLVLSIGLTQQRMSPSSLPELQDDAHVMRVASYNVHYIILGKTTGSWSTGDWERRKAPLDAAFKTLDADLVAFQEMESFAHGSDGSVNLTLDWLLEQNPGYAAAAIGDWREFPSTQPILYRRNRLAAIDQGWYFFSDTPDVIYSRTFNGSFPAFASWVRFEDQSSKERFVVVNVHFEFKSFSNRWLSAELVAKRTQPHIADYERVLLLGDLNAWHATKPVKILEHIGLDFLPVRGATYHLNHGINLIGAIDHIAHSSGVELATGPFVIRRKFLGEWPSDHYPVVADVKINPSR